MIKKTYDSSCEQNFLFKNIFWEMITGFLHLELVITLYPLQFNSIEDFDFLLVFIFHFFVDIRQRKLVELRLS